MTVKGITKPVVLDAVLNKQGDAQWQKFQRLVLTRQLRSIALDFGLGNYVPNVGDKITVPYN
ncbi:YceI family protein [Acinetobacter baumannii]